MTLRESEAKRVAQQDLVNKIVLAFLFFVFIPLAMWIVSLPEIIHYPDWVVVVVAVCIFCCSMVFLRRYRSQKTDILNGRNGLNLFFRVLLSGIIAFILTFLLSVPFQYYLVQQSKGNKVEHYRCEITGVTWGHAPRSRKIRAGVYFAFKGDTCHVTTHTSAVENIRQDNRFREYLVVLRMRKTLFNAYVVEVAEVVHK